MRKRAIASSPTRSGVQAPADSPSFTCSMVRSFSICSSMSRSLRGSASGPASRSIMSSFS
jgi:hypothetical protein